MERAPSPAPFKKNRNIGSFFIKKLLKSEKNSAQKMPHYSWGRNRNPSKKIKYFLEPKIAILPWHRHRYEQPLPDHL